MLTNVHGAYGCTLSHPCSCFETCFDRTMPRLSQSTGSIPRVDCLSCAQLKQQQALNYLHKSPVLGAWRKSRMLQQLLLQEEMAGELAPMLTSCHFCAGQHHHERLRHDFFTAVHGMMMHMSLLWKIRLARECDLMTLKTAKLLSWD